MNAAEVIELIKKLPPEEQQVVRRFVDRMSGDSVGDAGTSAHVLRDAALTQPEPKYVDPETFERVTKWAMNEHRELLSRLAK